MTLFDHINFTLPGDRHAVIALVSGIDLIPSRYCIHRAAYVSSNAGRRVSGGNALDGPCPCRTGVLLILTKRSIPFPSAFARAELVKSLFGLENSAATTACPDHVSTSSLSGAMSQTFCAISLVG